MEGRNRAPSTGGPGTTSPPLALSGLPVEGLGPEYTVPHELTQDIPLLWDYVYLAAAAFLVWAGTYFEPED